MTKYTINFPSLLEWESSWTPQEKKEIREIANEFKKEFCMSKEKTECATVSERPKVFCINCEHAIISRAEREKPAIDTLALCILTEKTPTINYITGLMDVSFTKKEAHEYGSFHYNDIVIPKKLFGVIPRKSYEAPRATRFAKHCKHCNPRGDCPTFKQYVKPVGHKNGKETQ